MNIQEFNKKVQFLSQTALSDFDPELHQTPAIRVADVVNTWLREQMKSGEFAMVGTGVHVQAVQVGYETPPGALRKALTITMDTAFQEQMHPAMQRVFDEGALDGKRLVPLYQAPGVTLAAYSDELCFAVAVTYEAGNSYETTIMRVPELTMSGTWFSNRQVAGHLVTRLSQQLQPEQQMFTNAKDVEAVYSALSEALGIIGNVALNY